MINEWTYSENVIKNKDTEQILGEALNENQAERIVCLHNDQMDDLLVKISDFSDKIEALSREMKKIL